MSQFKKTAIFVGVFFLISDVASVIGQILYQPLLTNPGFITATNVNEVQILWGALFEIITALTVAGTGIAIYPVLRKYNESLGLGYAIGRSIEGAIIAVGIICLLTILSLRHQFLIGNFDPITFQAIRSTLISFEKWTYLFGPNFILGINDFLIGYVLYKSKLVPRAISLLAMIDGPLIFLVATGVMFGLFERESIWGLIVALPMFIFEVSFAVWIIIRGFNQAALGKLTAKN